MVNQNSLESLGQELFNDVFNSGNHELVDGCIHESYENLDFVIDDSTELRDIVHKHTNQYNCSSPVAKDVFMKSLDEFCLYLSQKKE